MRCNWLRWLWGLVPLGLLIAFTYSSTVDSIQADLKSRTEAALKESGQQWAGTGFAGRDGHLAGRAVEESQQLDAIKVVRGVWGVRIAEDRSTLLDRADVYMWKAARADSQLRLTGFVPNERARTAIIDAARDLFPNVELMDEMKPARGAPPETVWLDGIKFGLTQLARLEPGGHVNLRDAEFEIDGRARSVGDYRMVRGALAQAVPPGVRLQADRVSPPRISPYTWSAGFDGSQLVLDGYVPSEQTRERILSGAKAAFPSAAIVDKMAVAIGEPLKFEETVSGLLTDLSALKNGKLAVSATTVKVTGHAELEQTANEVGARLNARMPMGYKIEQEITFDKPIIPVVKPYETSVVAGQDELRLTGYVPSETQRQALLEFTSTSFPGRRMVDELQIAIGQPEGWSICVDRGLDALKKIGGGAMVLRDDELALRGQTASEQLAKALPGDLRAATSRACKASVDLTLHLPPEPDLAWQAERSATGVLLSGQVPDSATREALVARAKALFPEAEVRDEMRITPASSSRWPRVAEMGLELLARLRSGRTLLNGQELAILGEAADTAAATAVRQRLKTTMPTGYSGRDEIQIKSDAMIWAEQEAKRRQEQADRARAEAEVRQREEEARKAEEARRREDDARRKVDAERKARDEADRKSREEAERRAEAQRVAEEAKRRAEAERLRREQEAKVAAAAELERKRLAAVRSEEQKRQETQDRCQDALNAAKTTGQINFEVRSSAIDAASHSVLDRLAEVAKACGDVQIQIEGHTDALGTTDDNMALSERRAQAVVDYLTAAGVAPERLIARGLGETQPLVPNDSWGNRARNRRIEFVVVRQ